MGGRSGLKHQVGLERMGQWTEQAGSTVDGVFTHATIERRLALICGAWTE